MAKRQKSVSLPRVFWENIEDFYNKSEDTWRRLKIDSPVELLQVMANLGEPSVEKLLAEFRALLRTSVPVDVSAIERLDKGSSEKKRNNPPQSP